MKIAQLLKKTNYYICSECRMKQHELAAECEFCGAEFNNYDEIITKIFMEKENDKRRNY